MSSNETPTGTRSPYLVTREAAEYLRISQRSLEHLLGARAVPCRRPAGTRAYRFLVSELEAYMNGHPVIVVADDDVRGVVVRTEQL